MKLTRKNLLLGFALLVVLLFAVSTMVNSCGTAADEIDEALVETTEEDSTSWIERDSTRVP